MTEQSIPPVTGVTSLPAGDPAAVAARRTAQEELYGATVADLLAAITSAAGLELPEIARTIGVSQPMLAQVRDGRRTRIGNAVAAARFAMLADLTTQLTDGAADPADTPLRVLEIAAAAGPVSAGPPVAASSGGLSLPGLRAARDRVAPFVRPSPALRWPLIEGLTGTETWVKHENHNPTGAFKVRGGLNYLARMLDDGPVEGLISASRGNHAQSLAFAGHTHGVPVTIVVPEGNSPDKNAATAAWGAEVIVHGADFQEALEHAGVLADERGLTAVPPYHPWLVEGVATYAAELHDAVTGLDVVYVPVGMGSGLCANIAVRDLLGLTTEIVGVVADRAPAYALSFEAGKVVTTPSADTFVDGVACRTPHPDAVAAINAGAARIVRIGEDEAAEATGLMYRCTHNLAEPAGALALAALLAEQDRVHGKKVAIVHTGGNCDFDVLAGILG